MCVLFTSCVTKMHNLAKFPHRYENVNLTITTQRDTIDDFIIIYVSFKNNSTNDIYLLDKRDLAALFREDRSWNFEIYFQDTVLKPIRESFCVLWSYPTKKDYILVKRGDTYASHFYLDFKEIAQKYLRESNDVNFREITHNRSQDSYKIDYDYGLYSIKLSYADKWKNLIFGGPIVRKAFKGKIESNVITVVYEP